MENDLKKTSKPESTEEEKTNLETSTQIEKTTKDTKKENSTDKSSEEIALKQNNVSSQSEMNTLNLKFSKTYSFDPTIYVDGKVLRYKKDPYGNRTTTYKTTSNTVTIEIKKIYDINGPLWFLTSLFFFIISVFGIFDLKPNKKCISVIATIKVKIDKNSTLRVALKPRTQLDQAFEITQENCEILEETGNKYFIDETAKKRYKIMRIVKVFSWLLLVASIFLIVAKTANLF